jgi:UDP-N-acetylglucosamine transferase subunit ALG13
MGAATEEIWHESAVLGECDLIFVTVGGMRGFERLVREMDRIASELDDRVVMQIGVTDYEPENCDYFRFVPRSEMEKLVAEARVVVCHAGTGSILTALAHNKPLVLVPRTKWYDEVFDDHQLEIATEMANRAVTVVYDTSDLKQALDNVNIRPIQLEGETALVQRLKEYLDHGDR